MQNKNPAAAKQEQDAKGVKLKLELPFIPANVSCQSAVPCDPHNHVLGKQSARLENPCRTVAGLGPLEIVDWASCGDWCSINSKLISSACLDCHDKNDQFGDFDVSGRSIRWHDSVLMVKVDVA
jgi:hypothetical protein